MSEPRNRFRFGRLLALFLLLAFACPQGWGGEAEYRRALVGLKVFAAFLAADLRLAEKCSDEKTLTLLLVHGGDESAAPPMAARLEALGSIRGFAVHAEQRHVRDLPGYEGPEPAGIFIAEWLPDLEPVLAFSKSRGTLVFSPFLGDVGRGAHGGLYVTDRILPLVDTRALDAAGIRIKPFFLDVARHYDED